MKTLVTLVVAVVLAATAGVAWAHWRHRHDDYPRKPDGMADIKSVFGRPCASRNQRVNHNRIRWRASDDGRRYYVNFHKKLGGATSSNLDHDVRGHLRVQKRRRFVRSGIGAYNCRLISGTNKYSTHAWGIAVDISWNYEHYGHNEHPCHVVSKNSRVPHIWKRHRWTWGRGFRQRDCMHFQYASGY